MNNKTDDDDGPQTITTAAGAPVASNERSRSAGPRGPLLAEDFYLFEKLAHFNRERIPERVVHAIGAGASGHFEVTHDISRHTRAAMFAKVGQKIDVVARFSTVAHSRGGPDIARDVRGFSVKFYTEQGNWDLVGNNTPVFFVRDPLKFMDFIRSQKEHPQRYWRHDQMWWDFWSRRPESVHQVMILMSDRGIPRGFRHMHGYGSHTFSMINAANERVWVKFHLITEQGIENFTADESEELQGKELRWATRDLFEAIEGGDCPRWRMKIQTMSEDQAEAFAHDPFDLTKVWPHADFPLEDVGVLELNRNPRNYFAEVEQAAFSPGNVVPGISWSPDPMLQARIISYPDAHRYRMGVNYEHIPVNCPHATKARTYFRDGRMNTTDNGGASLNYSPNGEDQLEADPGVEPPPLPLHGSAGRHPFTDENYYSQPGALYRLLSDEAKSRLVENICGSLGKCDADTQTRQVDIFARCDAELGDRIRAGLADD